MENSAPMLLTLTTTHSPATDLGFLLRKNPARPQTMDLPFGEARLFYPEADESRCTCCLQVIVDPVGLVRRQGGPAGEGGMLDQYVNDRPYAASSLLSVAIARVFGSALAGSSKERPDLVDTPLPLTATISALPCGGDGSLIHRLFAPLGYAVAWETEPLAPERPDWGASRYRRVQLTGTVPLHTLLSHLYVLVPVLDGDKHYWVGDAEVEKLVRHGEGWLAAHPERDLIARRYLKHRRSLVDDALARLGVDDAADTHDATAEPTEPAVTVHEQRLATVLDALKRTGATSVLDLGCGEGKLLRLLLRDPQFTRLTGMDVSHRALEIAADRLRLDQLPASLREKLTLLHGSLMYRDERLAGHDAAAVVEVIEHLDPPRLAAFERVLFECARPTAVVLTTPNRDYNALFPALPAGTMRHADHRFEWSRAEFAAWCGRIAATFGYRFEIRPVGAEDPAHGALTQMAVFTLTEARP